MKFNKKISSKIVIATLSSLAFFSPLLFLISLKDNSQLILKNNKLNNNISLNSTNYNPVVNNPNEINSKYFGKINATRNIGDQIYDENKLINRAEETFNNSSSIQYQLLENKVNDKYIKYIKYNINANATISNYTQYAYKVINLDVPKTYRPEIIYSNSQTITNDNSLFIDNSQNPNGFSDGKFSNTQVINYPYHNVEQHYRQSFGECVNAQTDGKSTTFKLVKTINLPTDINQWRFNNDYCSGQISTNTTGSMYDTNGEKWNFKTCDVKVNRAFKDLFNISLDNNNYAISLNISNVIDNSPQYASATCDYDYNNKTMTINISGRNLVALENDVSIYFRYKNHNSTFQKINEVSGGGNRIKIVINNVEEKPESVGIKLNYSLTNNSINTIYNINELNKPQNSKQKSLLQNNLSISSMYNQINDSGPQIKNDINPAGNGSFKFKINLENLNLDYSNNNVVLDFDKQHIINIKNTIYSNADRDLKQYAGSYSKIIESNDNVFVWYPKIQPLYEYLIKNICSDRTLDYDEEEMNADGLNINSALFATNEQKIALLEKHYNNVLNKVFNQNLPIHINNTNSTFSANQYYIYEPINYHINVEIRPDSCYLIFTYTFFDGREINVEAPFKTKLFLTNPDYKEDGSEWNSQFDLKINNINNSIDVSNDTILDYADQFYDLENNINGTEKLLNSILSYRDNLNNSIITPITKNNEIQNYNSIIQTRFTKEQFWYQLSQLNYLNQDENGTFDKNKAIWFDSKNNNNEPYNSWVDLAKGKSMEFDINVGRDLVNFYLQNYQNPLNATINQLKTFHYKMINFKTQYDFYYLNNSKNDKNQFVVNLSKMDNLDPEISGFLNDKIKAANWVIDNLILFDNQSGNTNNSRINRCETLNKVLATNLDKQSFISDVLNNDLVNNIYFSNYDKVNGEIDLTINLQNIGDLPASIKPNVLIDNDNKNTFDLLRDQQNKTFVFHLTGFRKNYDLQISNNLNVNAKNIFVNKNINTVEQAQTSINNISNQKEYIKNITIFNAYDNHNENTLNKIIKTRLDEENYFNKTEPFLNSSNDGLNYFNGSLKVDLDFKNRKNALDYNNLNDNNEYRKLTANDLPLSFNINNLNREILFSINQKYLVKDQNNQSNVEQYLINDFNQYIPSQLVKIINDNLSLLFKTNINNENDINNCNKSKNIDELFYINASSKEDLIKALKDKIINFEFNPNDKDGTLDINIIFNNFVGTVNNYVCKNNQIYKEQNDVNSSQNISFIKTIKIINLKKNTGTEFDQVKHVNINDINNYFKTNFQYIEQLTPEWILKNLILYYGENDVINKPYILDLRNYSNINYNSLINYLNFNNQISVNYINNSTELLGTLNFNYYTNGINNVNFIIDGFLPKASLDWAIEDNTYLNINNYSTKKISIDEFDVNFILDNMITFINQTNINKPILNNSFITKQGFLNQIDFEIQTKKNSDDSLNVIILTKRKLNDNQQEKSTNNFDSLIFNIYGFSSKSWWEQNMWYIIGSIIGFSVLILIIISIILGVKCSKKRKKKQ